MKVGTHVRIIQGRYDGYEGRVIGGEAAKDYLTVNVWGIHALRFNPDQLEAVIGS